MSLNDTVSAERIHISFFGRRNAGKSSLVNAFTGQELSVVSDVPGTTTDPVKKAMELLPLGPVLITDTAGFDDEGAIGEKRVEKTLQTLRSTDIAVLVIDAQLGKSDTDDELIKLFEDKNIPYITVYNKSDLIPGKAHEGENEIFVSAESGENVNALKEKIGALCKKSEPKYIIADKLSRGDTVILVIPIDESAPKGRLILPQQQTLRELLDFHCKVICVQPSELRETIGGLTEKPKVVITDSQAFGKVSEDVPRDIPLTSFSILFARYKGELAELIKGASALTKLKDGDKVLISEGCTHHRQCGDIGTVKMPAWIEKFTGKKPLYFFTSGTEFPQKLSEYSLIVHCGGCMLNEAEMKSRINAAKDSGVPIVNYGMAIALMHGILDRALEIFPEVKELL